MSTDSKTGKPDADDRAEHWVDGVERWVDRCESVFLFVAVLATFVMMLLTTADAVSRYAFNMPIEGAYEFTEKYLMIAMVFLGVSYAYRGGALIRVTFAVDALPAAVRVWVDYLVQIVSLAFFVLMTMATIQQSLRVFDSGTTLSTLELPLWPPNFLIPIGLTFLCALLLADVWRVRSGKSRLFSEADPES